MYNLRGIFDGGGVRKQNGHWQSSRKGKRASAIFHYEAYNDYFYGPAVWKKFNYGNAININKSFHFELVRTGEDDWSDYLATVGVSRIITNVQHLTDAKIVQKPDGGYYRITRSGDEGARYVIIERDAEGVNQNIYYIDISTLQIYSGDMNYGEYIRYPTSTDLGTKIYHINYSGLYEYNGQTCIRIEHRPYTDGQAGTSSYVYEPVNYSQGTLVMTPDPFTTDDPDGGSETVRFVNGGGAKMSSGSWPASFDMNIDLQVPAFDTSEAPLYNRLLSLINVPMSTDLELRYYASGRAVSVGHFVTHVYIT